MMNRNTKVMIGVGAAVIVMLLALALYGYLSGAWELPS